ncbi:deoxynucleotide monophosphate kinase [Variovorax sp. J22G73]|uniref:deoxynucleotide monophosphate kinase family protein n=1 Tax=unclassified Variovorax TaxID=663243 RepID=UPI002578E8A0|nr:MULTISPECIES: deoxynucleotide monophosphate kinase [unclassified Variovorax]MDM0006459.1 deoxynucleotide monophosphate kinase [Variovorax sp. J22R203]MDM0097518.1 deoxynucleotide monophosphate kinase [Variovorax sp. J22G73]
MQGKFPLIGLAAAAQSGKSTVAGMLVKRSGYQEISFAEPIRQFVCDLVGIRREELEPVKEDVIAWVGKSPRQMMQSLGTQWGRECVNQNFWCDRVIAEVTRNPGTRYVISDVRFENEARAIRNAGGVIIHLSRPDGRRTVVDHASEAGIRQVPGLDFRIVNDGTLDDLAQNVAACQYAIWKSRGLEHFTC